MRFPKLLSRLLLVALALGLFACAQQLQSPLRKLSVVAAIDANGQLATALDIVFVYDPNVAAALPKTGGDWFAKKQALLAGLGGAVDVVALQVPGGTVVDAVPLPARHKEAVRVLSYAHYATSQGAPVGDLTSRKCVRIVLEATQPLYRDCL